MSEYIAANSKVLFGKESTFGTKSSTINRFLGITNSSVPFPDKSVDVKKYRSTGTGRKYFKTVPGRSTRSSSINLLPTTGEIFYYAFGRLLSETGVGPYIHEMATTNEATLPSMSLQAFSPGDQDFLRTFVGTTVNSLNFTLSESAELEATIDVLATDTLDWDDPAPANPTQPTSDGSNANPCPFMYYDRSSDVNVGGSYDPGTMTVTGGTNFARVTSFGGSLSNNLRENYYSNSGNAKNPFNFTVTQPDFTLNLDLTPVTVRNAGSDKAIYQLLEDETKVDIVLPFQKQAAAYNDERLDLVFEGCILSEAKHDYSEDGGQITVPVTAEPTNFYVVSQDNIATYNV